MWFGFSLFLLSTIYYNLGVLQTIHSSLNYFKKISTINENKENKI